MPWYPLTQLPDASQLQGAVQMPTPTVPVAGDMGTQAAMMGAMMGGMVAPQYNMPPVFPLIYAPPMPQFVQTAQATPAAPAMGALAGGLVGGQIPPMTPPADNRGSEPSEQSGQSGQSDETQRLLNEIDALLRSVEANSAL